MERAIELGVPITGGGNPPACSAIHEVMIAGRGDLDSGIFGARALERLLLAPASGRAGRDDAKRAWIFRRTMDRVHQDASARSSQ